MTLVYDTALGQDLNLGTGLGQVTNPGGGLLQGHQINISTFGLDGAPTQAETATWDPGSVPAGQSVSTTITATGAALGDFVLRSFSLALGGLVLSADVDSGNTVRVTLSNPTAAAIDLASGTIKVLVLRPR